MSYQTCPDWPELMEIAPDLQFKHLTVRNAQLPADALMQIPGINLDEVGSAATSTATCSSRGTPTRASSRRCGARTGTT